MDPFNIVIRPGAAQIDLNIHPEGPANFKVVYAGELIGEVFKPEDGSGWLALPREQMQAGAEVDLSAGKINEVQDLLLDEDVVQSIGREISLTLNQHRLGR